MIDVAADLAFIYNTGDFTQNVTVDGQMIKAIFTAATESVSLLDGQVETHAPTLACQTVDVENVERGAAATVDGTAYTVQRNETVGTGQSVLYLKT